MHDCTGLHAMGGACAARVRVETDSCPSSMSTRTGDRILTSRAVYAAVFASTLEEMNSRMPFRSISGFCMPSLRAGDR